MPSTSAPSDARLFDGASARAVPVRVAREGGRLLVEGAAGRDAVEVALLRQTSEGGRVTLHRTDLPDWRLVLGSDAAALTAGIADLHRVTARQWWLIGGAVAAVLLVIGAGWLFGNRLLALAAPLVPQAVTERAGAPLYAMLAGGERACTRPDGEAALRRLVARLTAAGTVEPVEVRVARMGDTNAFTLPGGRIVLLRGLIGSARGPDEVAGVLAHELGHVEKRHPAQALLRHFGLDVLLGGVGGNMGSAAAAGVFLTNSRTAEREADEEALRILRAARVSPEGLAAFFERLSGRPERRDRDDRLGRLASLANTHPSDRSRLARIRAAASYEASPALSPAEWRALQGICEEGARR